MASTATRRISCGASLSASLSGLVYIGATGRRRDVNVQGRIIVHSPAATRMGRGGQPGKPRPRGVFKFSVEFLGGTPAFAPLPSASVAVANRAKLLVVQP